MSRARTSRVLDRAVSSALAGLHRSIRFIAQSDPVWPVPRFESLEARMLMARIEGIDVSQYQGAINWSQVRAAGKEFAFQRATEGGSADANNLDSTLSTNMSAGASAGMLMGVYHHALPDSSTNDAANEASWFLSNAGQYMGAGWMRPVIDIETNGGLTVSALSQWVNDFSDAVFTAKGVRPIIYSNTSNATSSLGESVTSHALWLARYNTGHPGSVSPQTSNPETPSGFNNPYGVWNVPVGSTTPSHSSWSFWQYSNAGSVSGITGNVDLDLFQGDRAALESNFVIPPSSAFKGVSVNFGPYEHPAPSGYINFGNQTFGNLFGYQMGWDTAGVVTATQTTGPDERYKTYAFPRVNGADHVFEIAVPNGAYRVRLVAGGQVGNTQKLFAEGVSVVNAVTNTGAEFRSGVATVNVTDGRLTISSNSTAANTRLVFLDVVPANRVGAVPAAPSGVSATAASSTAIDVRWVDNADNEGRDPSTFSSSTWSQVNEGYQIERRTFSGGSWGSWSTVGYARGNAELYQDTGLSNANQYQYRVSAVNAVGTSTAVEGAAVSPASSGSQQPYNSTATPWPAGTTIQAEDFDRGGEGTSYHDTSTGSAGGFYRDGGMDVGRIGSSGSAGAPLSPREHRVGWFRPGEWVEYTVNVPSAGFYAMQFRVAVPGAGALFHATTTPSGGSETNLAGPNATDRWEVPNTGDWDTFTTVTKTVELPAGTQVIRVYADVKVTTNPGVMDFDWFRISAVSDLSVDSVAEADETSVGRWVRTNSDHDEQNASLRGSPLPDNQPDGSVGERVVASDDELVDASIALSGASGTWKLTFPNTIRVWRDAGGGTFVPVQSGVSSAPVTSEQVIALKIEGVENSASVRDTSLKLTFAPTGAPVQEDTVKLTVADIDLDVDSDNDSAYRRPDHDHIEESLESDPTKPGKIIYVNDNDSDADGVADWKDGYNFDGVSGNADDVTGNEPLVSMPLLALRPYDPATAVYRISYSASDPMAASVSAPAAGELRLWRKAGDHSRDGDGVASGGDYLAPGDYTGAQLGLSSTLFELMLYAEAVNETTGATPVEIQVDPDGAGPAGFILSDKVFVTADDVASEPGWIGGYKWDDSLIVNGQRDVEQIPGDPPNLVYVIDVSGSTGDQFRGQLIGDINADGKSQTILDGELAALIQLSENVASIPGTERPKVGIVVFGTSSASLDMNSTSDGKQLSIAVDADLDDNGTADVIDILKGIGIGHGGVNTSTDYQSGLQRTIEVVQSLELSSLNTNVIFVSDGYPNPDTNPERYLDEVEALTSGRAKVRNLRAFGAGGGALLDPHLRNIDPTGANLFFTTDDLINGVGNLATSAENFIEPGIEGWKVYVDLNGNDQFDSGEPFDLTDAQGNYVITGLAPGTYTVREENRPGWTQSFPAANVNGERPVTVVGGEGVEDVHFGNHFTPKVDLDVDSDDDGNFTRSSPEDTAEDDPSGGKTVYVNDDDTDEDGKTDWIDFDGITGEQFVPLVLDLSQFDDVSGLSVTLTYSMSDPGAVTGGLPAPGHLRVWKKEGDLARSVADFVAAGTHTAASLGLDNSNKVITLWLEGVGKTSGGEERLIRADVVGGVDLPPGGLNDHVYVHTEPLPPIDGDIAGSLFHDRNRNGIRDGQLIVGSDPDVVFVIDVSESTVFNGDIATFAGSPVGDVNGDGMRDTILDAEIAGFLALNQQLIELGFGETARVSVVAFNGGAWRLDMNPLDLNQGLTATSPTADIDGNGIPDVNDVFKTLLGGGGTGYVGALNVAHGVLRELGTGFGNANVIFLSDGQPGDDTPKVSPPLTEPDPNSPVKQAADALRQEFGANVRAFGAGDVPTLSLNRIDPRFALFHTTDELLGAFGLTGGEDPEEGLSGWKVFIDENDNGLLDRDLGGVPTEPYTLTDTDGRYAFNNVDPGTYKIGVDLPIHWEQTSPKAGAPLVPVTYSIPLAAGDDFGGRDFGLVEFEPAPSADIATTGSMEERRPVTVTVTNAETYGPFRYSFDFNGDGDFEDDGDIFRSRINVASFTPDDDGNYSFTVRVHDSVGMYTDYPQLVTIGNAAPSVTIGGGVPEVVDLSGGDVTLNFDGIVREGSLADAGAPIDYEWEIMRGTDTILTGDQEDFAWPVDADNPTVVGEYTIRFAATDKDGGRGETSRTITLGHSIPRITAGPTASPSTTVTGKTVDLSVTAVDNGGAAALTYEWGIIDQGAPNVTFSSNATNAAKTTTATFEAAGTYHIVVLVTDANGNASLSDPIEIVVQQTLTQLIVSPRTVSLLTNDTQDLTAVLLDQFGFAMQTPPTVTWDIVNSPELGQLSATTGTTVTYTAGAAGSDTIEASVGSIKGTVTTAVSDGVVDDIVGAASDNIQVQKGVSTGQLALAGFVDLLYPASSANLSNYSAVIDWGDGTTTDPATVQLFTYPSGDTAYEVIGSHQYQAAGNYSFSVTLSHADGRDSAPVTGHVVVSEGQFAWTFVPFVPVLDVEFEGEIARFRDTGGGSAGNYSAEINWGDGAPANPNPDWTITQDTGTGDYVVTGTHTYASGGTKNLSITIKEGTQTRAVVSGSVAISDRQHDHPQGFDVPPAGVSGAISASQIYLAWLKEAPGEEQPWGYVVWMTEGGVRSRVPASGFITPIESSDNPGYYFRVIDGLRRNTEYTFTVQAVYTDGSQSPETPPLSITTWDVPQVPKPLDLQAAHEITQDPLDPNDEDEGVRLSWQTGDVDGYKIEVRSRDLPSGTWSAWELVTPSDQYIDPTPTIDGNRVGWFDERDVPGDKEFEYRVLGVKAIPNNPLLFSPEATVLVTADTVGPSTPTGLRAASFPQAIQLTWDDRPLADDADFGGWFIERSVDGGAWTTINVLPVHTELGYNDFTAPLDAELSYRIYAVDRLGNESPRSAVATHRRSRGGEPPAPTGLRGEPTGPTSVNLTWDPVTTVRHEGRVEDDLAGYNVYRKLKTAGTWSSTPVNGSLITSTSYSDATISASTDYEYRVTAVDGDGDESPASAATELRGSDGVDPDAPSNLAASALSISSIRVTWDSGGPGGTGGSPTVKFLVYRSREETAGYTQVATVTQVSSTNAYTDVNLASNTRYYYKVYAVDADGDVAESAAPTFATAQTPNAPDARPFVAITAPGVSGTPLVVSADTDVFGIVDDVNNDLDEWVLSLRTVSATGGTSDIVVARGGEEEEVGQKPTTAGKLGTIRATMVPDGLYELVLRAKDATGWAETKGGMVHVKTEVKVGNFTLPFVDMQIDVPGGSPIVVRRIYDSAQADVLGDFGYGWRLDLADTNLRTTARAGQRGDATTPALRFGDLVYVDLPGQGTHTFQFIPKPTNYDPGSFGQGFVMGIVSYYPQFVAVDGSDAELHVANDIASGSPITLTRDGDEFFTGIDGYNPSKSMFGGIYTVKAKDGSEYTIDAKTGKVTTSKAPNGKTTSYSDGTVSSNGETLKIQRFSDGRIEYVQRILPGGAAGPKVTYHYNETTKDLDYVLDETQKKTTFAYDATLPHRLVNIRDARGILTVQAFYDADTGRVSAVTDAAGKSVPIDYGGFTQNGGLTTVTDPNGNVTEQLFDRHGNVVREIRTIGSGANVKYQITDRAYNYVEGHIFDPIDKGESGLNKLSSFTEYEPFIVSDSTGARYTMERPASVTALRTVSFYLPNFDGDPTDPNLWQIASETVAGPDDANGDPIPRTTQFAEYHETGKPQKVTDPDGHITWTLYDAKGALKYTVNHLGEGQEFVRDSDGNVTQVWRVKDDDDNPNTKPNLDSGDRIGSPLTLNDYFGGRLSASTDAAGRQTFYEYWPDGRLKRTSRLGNSAETIVDSFIEYDAKGRVTKVYDGDGAIRQTFYDSTGNAYVTADKYGALTVNSYDPRGNLVRTLNADGTEVRYVYDDLGRLEFQSDPFASTSAYTFSRLTNALAWTAQDSASTYVVTETVYDDLGRAVATKRHKDAKIDITDGPSGSGAFETSVPTDRSSWAQISSTSTMYDDVGRVLESTNADGLRTGYIYHRNGQLKLTGPIADTVDQGDGDGAFEEDDFAVADGVRLVTKYDYDQGTSSDRFDTVIDARGLTTQNHRDAIGRVIETVWDNATPGNNADDVSVETLYGVNNQPIIDARFPLPDDTGHAFPSSFDGQHVIKVDQRGKPTHYLYDRAGRLTDIWQPKVADAESGGATKWPHWHYAYNELGNLTQQTDPKGRTTFFNYDAYGRRIRRMLPGGPAEQWTYDSLGRVGTHTDFKGQTTLYIYDPLLGRRLLQEQRFVQGVDSTPDEKTVYTYDELGRRETVTEYADLDDNDATALQVSRATTTYGYDPVTGGVSEVASPEGTIHHEYDEPTGRLDRTYTANNDTSYGYDDFGRLDTVTATKLNGQTVNLVTGYTYDAVGSLDTVTQPNGVVSDYGYDGLNRLTTLVVKQADGDKLFEQTFTLEADGHRDFVIEKRYDGTSSTPFSTTKIDWSYDDLRRLIGETRDEGDDAVQNGGDYTDTYAFDLAGNGKTKVHDAVGTASDETITSTYNERDQLTAVDSTIDANDSTYTYDLNGSTDSVTTGSSGNQTTKRYVWDLRNRMVGYDADGDGFLDDAGDATYGYDDAGQRVSVRTGTGPTTYYLNDANNLSGYPQILEEKSGTSPQTAALVRSYVLGLRVEGQADAAGTRWFARDGHGSTRSLVNEQGADRERYEYQAYGEAVKFERFDAVMSTWGVITATQAATVQLFGGDAEFDQASGFYYHDKRWRDGDRFTSMDSFEADPGNPAYLHKYVYAIGNPLAGTDPSGYMTLPEIAKVSGIVLTLGALIGGGIYWATRPPVPYAATSARVATSNSGSFMVMPRAYNHGDEIVQGFEVQYRPAAPCNGRIVLVQAIQTTNYSSGFDFGGGDLKEMAAWKAKNMASPQGIKPPGYVEKFSGGTRQNIGSTPYSLVDAPRYALGRHRITIVAVCRSTQDPFAPDDGTDILLGAINFEYNSETQTTSGQGFSVGASNATPATVPAADAGRVWEEAMEAWRKMRPKP